MEVPMNDDAHHLSGRHEQTLRRIFAHPMSHNVEWSHVLGLLHEVAQVDERTDGSVEVWAGEESYVLQRTHAKDLSDDDLETIRSLMRELGLEPRQS
jgi:hypothetical protein